MPEWLKEVKHVATMLVEELAHKGRSCTSGGHQEDVLPACLSAILRINALWIGTVVLHYYQTIVGHWRLRRLYVPSECQLV